MHPGHSCLRRKGLGRGDVVVLLVLIGITALLVIMGLSRAREHARLAGCTRNLSQIGFGLALYDRMNGHLPGTATMPPDLPPSKGPSGPLRALLESLDLPDLTGLRDPQNLPKGQPGHVPGEVPVPGFICASDPNAISGWHRAPVSYRASTGDSHLGDNGAFAPGHAWSLAAIEARDGLSYTAAFSERLVGNVDGSAEALGIYRVVSPPLQAGGCTARQGSGGLRDDAGSSWVASDYRSTLYNHALTPNGRPSCIADDGRTAYMGASSGHIGGVNLLRLDGSVTRIVPTIAPKVWRELAAVSDEQGDQSP